MSNYSSHQYNTVLWANFGQCKIRGFKKKFCVLRNGCYILRKKSKYHGEKFRGKTGEYLNYDFILKT